MSTAAPTQSRSEIIKRLEGNSNALAALLSVIDLLPDADKQSTLATCSNIANDVAFGLAMLVGGAK